MKSAITNITLVLAFALISNVALAQHASSQQQAGLNGKNVKMVLYGTTSKTSGAFVQVAPGRWIEHNNDGRFNFRELYRGPWSVFLEKVGRQGGQKIMLNLHTKKVREFTTPNGQVQPGYVYYRILQSFK